MSNVNIIEVTNPYDNTTSEQVVITYDDGTSTVMFKDFYDAQQAYLASQTDQ